MRVRYGKMRMPRIVHRTLHRHPNRMGMYTANKDRSLRVVSIDIRKMRQTRLPYRLYVGVLLHELSHWWQDVRGRPLCEDEASRWERRWYRLARVPSSLGNGWFLVPEEAQAGNDTT